MTATLLDPRSPVTIIGAFALIYLLLARLLEWVWNITCPQLFGLPAITYWQAFRLMVIAGLLLGAWHYAVGSNGVSVGL